ncbi:MAG: M48 family metallopeptidase [Bradymonadales bacterium]
MDDVFKAIWLDDMGPKKEISCRSCNTQNRVHVAKAVQRPQQYCCARCDAPLFLSHDAPFTQLKSHSFEHPLDASTLRNLRSLPGAAALVKIIQKHFNERSTRELLQASAVACSEQQFPELHALVQSVAHSLGFGQKITPYLSSHPFVNAYTESAQSAYIVFTSELFDQFSDAQLRFVIGHELGHILSEHAVYRRIAVQMLQSSLNLLPGLARYASYPLRAALYKWLRCSELSADRAGLLASRDLQSSLEALFISACGKNPGLDARATLSLSAFIAQAQALKQNEANPLQSLLNYASSATSHPMIAWRINELIDWVERGTYLDILAGDYV